MQAMVFEKLGEPLRLVERPDPRPGAGELLIRIEACGVCRTDLHLVDGELSNPRLPVVPGHEIVGTVVESGDGVPVSRKGQRVGVPWLGKTCGYCQYCRSHAENLCSSASFTGYTRDGGYATHVIADARYAFELRKDVAPASLAPLLCAGLIGWRSLKKVGSARKIGIYGFGAAAHIVAQICRWQGREIYAFTSKGDRDALMFAKEMGAAWAGASDETAPEPLDAAIIFAPVGALVPIALKAVRKGGKVVCGGIHMSDIPQMPYALLWEERSLTSVANLTRQDATEFLDIANKARVRTTVTTYPLYRANDALSELRSGRVQGAAVLMPQSALARLR